MGGGVKLFAQHKYKLETRPTSSTVVVARNQFNLLTSKRASFITNTDFQNIVGQKYINPLKVI